MTTLREMSEAEGVVPFFLNRAMSWERWFDRWRENRHFDWALGMLHGIFDGALAFEPRAVMHLIALIHGTVGRHEGHEGHPCYAGCGYLQLHEKAVAMLVQKFLKTDQEEPHYAIEMLDANPELVALLLSVLGAQTVGFGVPHHDKVVIAFLERLDRVLRNRERSASGRDLSALRATLSQNRPLLFETFIRYHQYRLCLSSLEEATGTDEMLNDLSALEELMPNYLEVTPRRSMEEALRGALRFPNSYVGRFATIYVTLRAVYRQKQGVAE